MNELNYQGDLEKDIIGTFFIDSRNECISKTILQPKHFLDEKNRKMFMIQKEYYKKNGNVDVFEMLKDYESPNAQQTILEYYNYAAEYIIGTSFFKKNEERLITRWQKETSKQLFEQYQN